jgi:hypothetical protein
LAEFSARIESFPLTATRRKRLQKQPSDGVAYAAILTKLTSHIAELEALGVQLKDFERGLIDFPSLRDGRIVLLCWQLGEGDELEWWHDVDAGFAGRTPL